MQRLFVYTMSFERELKQQPNAEAVQLAVEDAILSNPAVGATIAATGGVRKFRLPDPKRGKGKRGGLRIIYLDLPAQEVTYLIAMFDKNTTENLTEEDKSAIRNLVAFLKGGLR